jgi:plasmid maintenance system antidote protein VapI
MISKPGKPFIPAVFVHEVREALALCYKAFASQPGIFVWCADEIIYGIRTVDADKAWLLSVAFSTTAAFWLDLQTTHNLSARGPICHVGPIVTG